MGGNPLRGFRPILSPLRFDRMVPLSGVQAFRAAGRDAPQGWAWRESPTLRHNLDQAASGGRKASVKSMVRKSMRISEVEIGQLTVPETRLWRLVMGAPL